MDPNTPVGGTTLAKIEKASIKRIMKDLATTEPELFRDAIIAGLLAPPPRSFPYIALAAAYLDGKPVDAGTHRELDTSLPIDLSSLSREQLGERAEKLVRMLKASDEVIDATIVDDLTPEQLQEEIRLAQVEVDRANADVERHNAALRSLEKK